jgi:hypothetical protein
VRPLTFRKSIFQKSAFNELPYLPSRAVFSNENETDKRFIAGYTTLDFLHGADNEMKLNSVYNQENTTGAEAVV